MLIDGKKINTEIGENLQKEISIKNILPSLGILCVGEDKASLSFINVKKKFGEKYGFVVNLYKINEGESKDLVIFKLQEIQKVNDAVIVQLPLPNNLKIYTEEILKNILPEKDVDNLNNGSFETPIILALEKSLSLTPALLLRSECSLAKGEGEVPKTFGIIGLGQVVGMPVKEYLEKNNLNFKIIGHHNYEDLQSCDILVSGIGQPHSIKKEFIKDGVILIDYGCSYLDGVLCGDFNPECFEKASFYTPVPGGMGPIVVACLFENVLKSFIPREN